MVDLSRDPLVNVVQRGIKEEIRLLLSHDKLRGALLLTLSGVDTMGYLVMDKSKEDVSRSDFITWADRYISFPCKEQVTGLELYGARCAALHNYGTESQLSREGRCRQILWMSKATPEVAYNPAINPGLVVVSIPALAEAFFAGVDRFLVDIYSDSDRAKRAEERFRKIMHALPGPGSKKV